MKKITLLASVCALFMAPALVAQETQEVQYVEDATQGYLINSFKDNWFITAQGGVDMYFSARDIHRDLQDRFSPAANIYVGKWFTPVFGGRVGVDWMKLKGLGDQGVSGYLPNEHQSDGYYKTSQMEVGPVFDVMANLTNLFCGYKPNRVYNATLYVGGGAYWTFVRDLDKNGNADGWKDGGDVLMTLRAGIINSFNVSKQVQLSLDLRASAIDGYRDVKNFSNPTYLAVQAYLGVTYLFNNRTWKAPVVPVCPPAENCDALRARLAAADSRIADLEAQLRDCLNRPVQVQEAKEAPLATIYYPINAYRLTREDNNVLEAIANVMKSNSDTNYVLTGWADNYTGTDAVNKRVRQNRVNGVYNKLVKCGVAESQLTATTNDGSLSDLGEKYVALDRAVTIEEAK
jgi:outer membrane protein OmpA-like peptidoglycan-associated protein